METLKTIWKIIMSDTWQEVKGLSMRMKALGLFLILSILAIGLLGLTGCKATTDTYISANYQHSKVTGPDQIDYILSDQKLDKFNKRVRVMAIIENMQLNYDTAKQELSVDDTELADLIRKYKAESEKLKE